MFSPVQWHLVLWYEFLLFILFYHLFEMKIAYLGFYVFPSLFPLPPRLSGILCSGCTPGFLLLFENQLRFTQRILLILKNPLSPAPGPSPDVSHSPC